MALQPLEAVHTGPIQSRWYTISYKTPILLRLHYTNSNLFMIGMGPPLQTVLTVKLYLNLSVGGKLATAQRVRCEHLWQIGNLTECDTN